jgi:tRNA(fMet)-specific endonuclease VapC
VAYLFDTDAISEVLRPRPAPAYLRWLSQVPRAEQFTSAVVIGELYKGAFRSPNHERHLENIEKLVLPAVTVLPYDVAAARVFGDIQARLSVRGRRPRVRPSNLGGGPCGPPSPLADADLQIAATAILHGLDVVTGNLRHFARIPGIQVHRALADARGSAG